MQDKKNQQDSEQTRKEKLGVYRLLEPEKPKEKSLEEALEQLPKMDTDWLFR